MRSFGIISFDIENLPVQQKLLMALNKDYLKENSLKIKTGKNLPFVRQPQRSRPEEVGLQKFTGMNPEQQFLNEPSQR